MELILFCEQIDIYKMNSYKAKNKKLYGSDIRPTYDYPSLPTDRMFFFFNLTIFFSLPKDRQKVQEIAWSRHLVTSSFGIPFGQLPDASCPVVRYFVFSTFIHQRYLPFHLNTIWPDAFQKRPH